MRELVRARARVCIKRDRERVKERWERKRVSE